MSPSTHNTRRMSAIHTTRYTHLRVVHVLTRLVRGVLLCILYAQLPSHYSSMHTMLILTELIARHLLVQIGRPADF